MPRIPSPAGLTRYQRTIQTRFAGECLFCEAATAPGIDYAALNGKGKWVAVCATCASSVVEQLKGLVRSAGAVAATLDADTVSAIQAQHADAFANLGDALAGKLGEGEGTYTVALAVGRLRAALRSAVKAAQNGTQAPVASPTVEVTPGLWMVGTEPFLVRMNRAGTNCYALRLAAAPQSHTKLAWDYFKGGIPVIARTGRPATADEAAALGHLTDHCCFCGLTLTDDGEGRSVEVGYGPVCARKHNLPWG